jgi:hypothetical protein
MSALFFNQNPLPGQIADAKKRTRSEQSDIVDRVFYSAHLEDHPKGINRYDAPSDPDSPKKLGRPKKGAKGYTLAEREERRKRGKEILDMLGIGMRYDEIARQPSINLEPGQVREIARYWAEKRGLS